MTWCACVWFTVRGGTVALYIYIYIYVVSAMAVYSDLECVCMVHCAKIPYRSPYDL